MAVGLAADMKTANFVTGSICVLRWIWRTPAVFCATAMNQHAGIFCREFIYGGAGQVRDFSH